MNGVDILAMEEVAVKFAFNWMCFWIIFAIFCVAGLCLSIYYVKKKVCNRVLISVLTLLFTLLGSLFGMVAGASLRYPVKYETRYKVSVTDEVKMTEFLEKYEIIENEGKIYTVREK